MKTLVLFIHTGLREPYRAAAPDADLIIVNKGAFGTAYKAYAATLPQTGRLRALCEDVGAKSPEAYDRVLLMSFSAGYALVRWVLSERESADLVSGYVAIDSIYASKDNDPDDPADDAQMAPFVALALRAAEGRAVCFVGCTDVPTPYASTSQTATHIARAAGLLPPTVDRDQTRGLLRIVYHDDHASDGAEHSAALASWGPRLFADAMRALDELPPRAEAPDVDPGPLGQRALVRAISYLGVSESHARHRKMIKAWHALVGGSWLTYVDPWCASFACACAIEVGGRDLLPHAATFRVREIWSSAFARGTAVGMSVVRRDPARYIVPGNLLCMARGGLPRGEGAHALGNAHVGRIEAYNAAQGAANTVDGNKGDTVRRMAYALDDPALVGVVVYPGAPMSWEPTADEIAGIVALESDAFRAAWLDT